MIQMPNVTGSEAFYKLLSDMARVIGFTTTFASAGKLVPTSYLAYVDNIVIYSGSSLPSLSYVASYYPSYNAVCRSFIVLLNKWWVLKLFCNHSKL